MSYRKTYNLRITKKDTKSYALTFEDVEGVAIDITGWTLYFTVKANLSDSDEDAIISKDVTLHTDPTNGKTKVTVTSDDTDHEPGNYYYDFQFKKLDNSVTTFLKGHYIIKHEVTLR